MGWIVVCRVVPHHIDPAGAQPQRRLEQPEREHPLALALSLPLVVRGGGALALDGWLAERVQRADARLPQPSRA
ncbi:MAG: hypothetical protein E6J90_05655 [Deltaproteobacteria bacterium]|nr:MAG: hypothetical protein E6J91_07690 [Deltaproteobacteria bacterium]TMQ25600.1 MAG: hypothetical protein E6J90_05655 [Deltaproteobacteria bacterium]